MNFQVGDAVVVGLMCNGCGQVIGTALVSPAPQTVKVACVKCAKAAMGDKPATNGEEWGEVFKKLKKS